MERSCMLTFCLGILFESHLQILRHKQNRNAPAKVNALIGTIVEIAQHYNLIWESFFLAVLLSYQEAHNNYFKDLELKALQFFKAFLVNIDSKISIIELSAILSEEYGYTIQQIVLSEHEELGDFRSIFVSKSKTLLLLLEVTFLMRKVPVMITVKMNILFFRPQH